MRTESSIRGELSRRPAVPTLMAISDFSSRPQLDAGRWIDALVANRIDAVQIRAKSLPDRQLEALVRRVVQVAAGRLTVLVNGRADIAQACGADGVHLPAAGVPASALRQRFPALLLGLSTHHSGEIQSAANAVDYVTFSPIFKTPSKAAYGPPQGLEALRNAASLGLPVLALGGVCSDQLEAVAAAGAAGAAAIRALQDPDSLVEMGARAARCWPR